MDQFIFNKGAKATVQKSLAFSTNGDRISICQKKNSNPHLAPYTKIKLMRDYRHKLKIFLTIKLLGKKIGHIFCDFGTHNDFLQGTQKE